MDPSLQSRLIRLAEENWLFALVILMLFAAVYVNAPQNGEPRARPTDEGDPEAEWTGELFPVDRIRARFPKEPVISVFDEQQSRRRSMPLETYIKAVVAGETPVGWELETLAAQAVIARSFTVARVMSPRNACRERFGTDACTSPRLMQAYNEEAVDETVRTAVRMTRGLLLTYRDHLIPAYFHSCSGERTAALEESFPDKDASFPFLRPVPSRCLEIAPDYAAGWNLNLHESELARAAGTAPGFETLGILSFGPSGRALNIRIGDRVVHAADLRRRLGFNRMKSTAIERMERVGRRIELEGVGWGHGVGLDQWGAEAMARDGSDHRRIIEHFFPQSELISIWE